MFSWNLNHNNFFFQQNTFENVICQISNISFRPQWVKHGHQGDLLQSSKLGNIFAHEHQTNSDNIWQQVHKKQAYYEIL